MRRVMALLLSLTLVMGFGLPSFAATASAGVPKDVLTLINPYNFSNEANDESETTLKWLRQSGLKKEVLDPMVRFNAGVQLGGEFLDFTGYLTFREVVKPWATLGKADPKLGQAYESKVNLTMGQASWETYLIHTKAWVKKTGVKYAVTKVQYSITESKPSIKGKQFVEDNQDVIKSNYFLNLENLYASLFDLEITEASYDGINVTAADGATLYEKFCVSSYDTANLDPDMAYVLATITVDKPVILDTQFFVYGLAEGFESDESILDVASDTYLPYKDGWLLEPGKTYEYLFSATGEDDAFNNGQYYTDTLFIVKAAGN